MFNELHSAAAAEVDLICKHLVIFNIIKFVLNIEENFDLII